MMLHPIDSRRDVIYRPVKRPGFTAWTTAFDYGNGRIGLSFKETVACPNPDYAPPALEDSEVIGAPVSYGSVCCGDPGQTSYRVYLASDDCGRSFYETGRCPISEGSFCNVGFPDGRILGFDAPEVHKSEGGILVRESTDGGKTWQFVDHILTGTAPYLWRVRRLRSGTILLLCCFFGTPWGPGRDRSTRNTLFPGESHRNKLQPFFLTSEDGRQFSGPHYVLPGTGAPEYDCAELEDGSLLFIAGDTQGTQVARQQVYPSPYGWINGSLYGVEKGAPPDPVNAPQGGYIPESIVALPGDLLVGGRRNRPYAVSNDLGANWHILEGLPKGLYQPFLLRMPDGTLANFGHLGGDQAFGQEDMWIGADFFRLAGSMPQSTRLTLSRVLSDDRSHYLNRFRARLTSGGQPVCGEAVTFRFQILWKEDGNVNTAPQKDAPLQITAVTNAAGCATADVSRFDSIADIHFSFRVDVVYEPDETSGYAGCPGPAMACLGLRPHRNCRHPYDGYFAEGTLFLAPQLLEICPDLLQRLEPLCGRESDLLPDGILPEEIIRRLTRCGVLRVVDGSLRWLRSVHAPTPLNKVLLQADGDEYH